MADWYEDFTSGGYDSDFNYGAPAGGDVGVILNPDGTLSGGSGIGAVTGTSGGSDWSKLLNSILGKATTPAGALGGITALYGMLGGNKPQGSPGWRGKIDPEKYTYNRTAVAQPAYVPYSGSSAPVMGRKNFESSYTKKAAAGGIMELARGGSAKPPRYLEGATDGMADKLSTSIDGEQPAALSHGEFVIPADVVSHLGNGNSKAGADQLYKMMDRIRQARTGNKKQGKRINPDKFTPGGIAEYAGGGVVAFATGGTPTVTTGQGSGDSMPVTSESNLSEWAAPGVTNYLEKGMALANSPYQAYTGPLTAGTSPLQQQAFTNASNLQVPAAMGQATTMIGDAGNKLGALSYNPQQATNQYTATGPYTGSNIGIDQFNTANMQRYMNPYMQMALDPQIAEARRQSEITQMGNASKLAQAGAYGGSRGALMQSEAQRNLGTNLANITGQGYNTAFDKAMGAFNTQQGLGLQAQQANEQSRQFGANQALSNAQNTAQYGQQAQGQNIQQQQFGANYGLSGLQGAVNAGTALGGLGAQQNQMGLANLNTMSTLGGTQRGIEQEGIDALYKQYEQERLDPYKQVQFQQSLFQGLPVSTVTGSTATSPVQQIGQAGAGGMSVYDTINKLLGNP